MVDLPLMARLLEALPAHARLVLLGDRDQLASVEAGNVLAAICAAAGEGAVSPARAALVEAVTGATLAREPRGAATSPTPWSNCAARIVSMPTAGWGRVAALVRDGDARGLAGRACATGHFAGVALDAEAAQRPLATLVERHLSRFAGLAACADPREALGAGRGTAC